jgi:putative ATP-dependent endonuclease of the OLD family
MLLRKIQIENFRGITKLDLELDSTTVLIGENNTGKTSVLEALHTCMNRGLTRRAVPFTEYDFHLSSDKVQPADAPPLAISLTYEESKVDEWPDEIAQAFPNVMQTLDDGRQRLAFRVTAKYDKPTRDFAVEWCFLDKAGNVLPTAKQFKLVTDLQQLAPVFLLSAVRDASQHFHAKSAFWGPFTKNPQITDEKQKEIEGQIEQINQSILDSHKPFEVVKERIAQTGKLLPLASKDLVSVEAVPARIFDMLSRTQVKLAARTGARLPISQHGAGTQSLSVLFLFEAFLQSRLIEAYDKHSSPILALEEPESHLHPSAVRALWAVLNKLAGQKIIATHSGDLLAAVPLPTIRRLARRSGNIEVFRLDPVKFDARDLEKLAYHIRAKRGSLLFARCWLLVEGETDFSIIPELARILGHDLDLCGVSCVEFAQVWPTPLIKCAQEFGIEWHLLADGDASGTKYVKAANDLRGTDPANGRITQLKENDIEHCLWQHGYHAFYEAAVDKHQKQNVKAKPGDLQYPSETIKAAIASTSKPQLAYGVIAEIEKKGVPGIPPSLKSAIETAVTLAKRCA